MTRVGIYIATHNRAAILAETLEAMARVRRQGIDARWYVINNNCTDNTDDVVRAFSERLPVEVVHETKPGKNRALNRALDCHPLPEIAVFTDDDVTPAPHWIEEIVACCDRWPEHDVFGGRILPRWPRGTKPDWIRQPWLLSIGFAWHDHGDEEMPYPPSIYPFGPNFWVRGMVFADGLRYQETIGPAGNSRIMGSETSFLKDLDRRGHRMVYCPAATVEHRIKEGDCDLTTLERRMASYGRGRARIHGVDYRNLLTDHPRRWWLRQAAKLIVAHLRLSLMRLIPSTVRRRERMLWQHSQLGWLRESLLIGRERLFRKVP